MFGSELMMSNSGAAGAAHSGGGIIKNPKDTLMENIAEEEYQVTNFYKKHGVFQRIARSSWFQNGTLYVILANSIWMGYEADFNTATSLEFADARFQIAENIFCICFTCEIL